MGGGWRHPRKKWEASRTIEINPRTRKFFHGILKKAQSRELALGPISLKFEKRPSRENE